MGLGARASLAAAILTAAGCGNAFSSSPGTDAGGGADVTSADVSSGDAGPTDAAMDAGGPADASSGTDATDATDAPAPAGNYCQVNKGKYDFCADFDEAPNVTQLLTSWTTYSSTGGAFTFDTTDVPSPPNALLATTATGNGVRTLAIHAMPPPTGPVFKQRLEFSFLVDTANGDTSLAAAAVAAILFGDDVSGGAVGIAFGNGSSTSDVLEAIYEGPTPDGGGLPAFGQSSAPPPFPTLGTWDGIFALEITYPPATGAGDASSAPAACAQLYIGGIPQLSPCLALPASLSKPTPVTSIALGVFAGGVGSIGNVSVGFDNVTFIGE